MLDSWRVNPEAKGPVPLRRVIDPTTARPVVLQACNRCRAKKLKCTGEKTGCSRCQTLSRSCIYHVKKADRRATASSQQTNPKVADGVELESDQRDKLPEQRRLPDLCSSPNPPPSSSLIVSPVDLRRTSLSFQTNSAEDFTSLMLSDFGDTEEAATNADSSPSIETWLGPPKSSSCSLNSSSTRESWFPVDPSGVMQMPLLTTSSLTQGPDGNYQTDGSLKTTYSRCPTLNTQDTCRCLQQIVILMEEHDDNESGDGALAIDAMLASLKESIYYGDVLLGCRRCQTRLESMTILTFLTDRLVSLCERLVMMLQEGLQENKCVQDFLFNNGEAGQDLVPEQMSSSSSLWLGCYEMDSLAELVLLLQCLSVTHLRALIALMDRLQRHAAGQLDCESVGKKAAMTKSQIDTLLQKLTVSPASN
ncbi:hypothetical protein EV127DRAFT_508915 [Xylaria flabelliformis]|nr:hypothetical protein EV127DRAFT_508915 [Xylaria flabelliformis]